MLETVCCDADQIYSCVFLYYVFCCIHTYLFCLVQGGQWRRVSAQPVREVLLVGRQLQVAGALLHSRVVPARDAPGADGAAPSGRLHVQLPSSQEEEGVCVCDCCASYAWVGGDGWGAGGAVGCGGCWRGGGWVVVEVVVLVVLMLMLTLAVVVVVVVVPVLVLCWRGRW